MRDVQRGSLKLPTSQSVTLMKNKRIDFAAEKLKRLRQLKALDAAAGSWKDKDHPELKRGAATWVAELRRQDEKRYKRIAAR
ncbi:MAG TPA: hypothetical protein VGV35_01125 [Bryobacteraceae bacterium]|nr:hypothetical protein [Bryobacteraceae bacterium]